MADKTVVPNGQVVTWGGILRWLPILLTLATLLVSLGMSQARMAEIGAICDENKAQLRLHDATFLELQVRLAEMQKDVSYIRVTVDRLDSNGG
mgnify:CR=1 FL=1